MFDKRPINPVRNFRPETISSGYDQLLALIEKHVICNSRNTNYIALEGTNGVPFQSLIKKIQHYFEKHNFVVKVINVKNFMKSGNDLRNHF
jgi:hypothetical protein